MPPSRRGTRANDPLRVASDGRRIALTEAGLGDEVDAGVAKVVFRLHDTLLRLLSDF